MNRNAKALMLVLTVLLVLSPIPASPAAAAEFHSSSAATTITATADGTAKNSHHVIDVGGASLTCGTVSFSSSISSTTTSEIKAVPTYSNCTYVGQTAIVNFHGCQLNFTDNGTIHIETNPNSGTTCAANPATISIPSPPCTITTFPQTISGAASYTNIKPGSVEEITLSVKATGTKYEATGSGCPETGSFSNGEYTTGNTILTGSSGGSMTNLRWTP